MIMCKLGDERWYSKMNGVHKEGVRAWAMIWRMEERRTRNKLKRTVRRPQIHQFVSMLAEYFLKRMDGVDDTGYTLMGSCWMGKPPRTRLGGGKA